MCLDTTGHCHIRTDLYATSRRHGHFCCKYQENTQINLKKARFLRKSTDECLCRDVEDDPNPFKLIFQET